MSKSTQTSLNAADDHRHTRINLTTFLRINCYRAIWALTALITRGIGIVMSQTTISCVAIDHGIHIASGHAEIQVGLAQFTKTIGIAPIGLRQNTDSETLRF